MDFNVLSTQNWSRMFNVWIEDIHVVCLPAVIAPSALQHCFLRKVRSFARFTSVFVIFFFALHCTHPRTETSSRPAPLIAAADPWETPPDVFTEAGQASWYGGRGDGFAGRRTANGERYDPTGLTCAHRTLPFGTLVEVENLETGIRTTVRVNDRGPFVRGRILDVSRKAAATLGMLDAGVAGVRLRTVDAQGRPTRLDPGVLADDSYTIQVAALSDRDHIERLTRELRASFGPVTLQDAQVKKGLDVKRVRVGSYNTLEEAQVAAEHIAKFFKDRSVEPFITRQR
jgi:rare lipoprotein A